MANSIDADFTHKELCLLLSTVFEEELGVVIAKSMKDVRAKVDVFENNDTIEIKRIQNKQGKTKVSVFKTTYGYDQTAYTVTV